jgi:YidC/Oxa1 family membrane protein insertase
MWSLFVAGLTAFLAGLAQSFGGSLGLAIVTFSLLVRLAVLPLTLRAVSAAQRQQAQFRQLQLELARLRARYQADPVRLNQEVRQLYQRQGYRSFDLVGLLGTLVQLPMGAGVYAAIRHGLGSSGRFLWMADLSRPDVGLALVVAGLSYAASVGQPAVSEQSRWLLAVLPTLVTAIVVWRLAAGLGVYWAVGSAVNLGQALLLRRRRG